MLRETPAGLRTGRYPCPKLAIGKESGLYAIGSAGVFLRRKAHFYITVTEPVAHENQTGTATRAQTDSSLPMQRLHVEVNFPAPFTFGIGNAG